MAAMIVPQTIYISGGGMFAPRIMQVEPDFRLSLFEKKKTKLLREVWRYKIIIEEGEAIFLLILPEYVPQIR